MHPLLKTLDLGLVPAAETSVYDLHPVRSGASTRSRGVPLLFSLGLTPLLIYGLSISLMTPPTLRTMTGAANQARNAMAILMQEPGLVGLQAQSKTPTGPAGSKGAGHQEGSGTLDPRLLPYATQVPQLSEAIDPNELSDSSRARNAALFPVSSLPQQVGGNGLVPGTGLDPTNSPGGGLGQAKGTGVAYDFKLVPSVTVRAFRRLSPRETVLSDQPVKVRIVVGDDGVPLSTTVVSGPPFLYEDVLKAARQWRFEPLAPHGLKAPISTVITFRLNFLAAS